MTASVPLRAGFRTPSSQPLPERLFYNNGPGNRAGRNGMAAATQPARRPRHVPRRPHARHLLAHARHARADRDARRGQGRHAQQSPRLLRRRGGTRGPGVRTRPRFRATASASASSFHSRARRRPRSPPSPAIARTSRRPGSSQATRAMTACISAPCSSASTSTSSIASRTRCRRRRPTWSAVGSSCCGTRRTPRASRASRRRLRA